MNAEPCKEYEDRLYAALFDEVDDTARAEVDVHRAGCPACDTAYRQAEAAVHLVTRHAPELPDEAYWDTYYDRLQARLAAAPATASRADRAPARRRWQPAVLRIAAVAVILLLGVLIGRSTVERRPVGPSEPDPGIIQASLDAQTVRYLDRTNVLLLGLVNFDPVEDDPAGINLPARQRMARSLLEETVALNEALDPSERLMLRELMADLERVLLQIANLETSVDLPSIELVQRGVDQNALLLKINLARMRVVEQQAVQAPIPTTL
ncbi:MAG: hypothetical protein R2834_05090 [Rhodothermales bacterium]